MRNIFLIGFMGSGKSTLSRFLAKYWGKLYFDTDLLLLEKYHATTISELFATIGEAEFRNAETDIIESIPKENCIIATGGGLPCFNDNMKLMNNYGDTIYIYCDNDTLFQRLKLSTDRPLLQPYKDEALKSYISDLLRQRTPYYTQATYIINNNGTIDEAIAKLTEQIDTTL